MIMAELSGTGADMAQSHGYVKAVLYSYGNQYVNKKSNQAKPPPLAHNNNIDTQINQMQ